MVWAAVAVAGATIVSGSMQSRAAKSAASSQERSAQEGIEEQRRQFDEITKILEPYVSAGQRALPGYAPFQEAGTRAFQQQQALSGLLGPEAQRAAISTLEQGPEYQGLVRQGEEALLQRASATGGLRGGNIQAALAQFRPQMLSGLIEQQLGRLGGFSATGLGVTGELASLGQASAARQAALGSATGSSISGLLGQQGAARAAGALGQAQAYGRTLTDLGGIAGGYFGRQAATPLVPTGGYTSGSVQPALGFGQQYDMFGTPS
jgi:hypothetical protein